MDDNNPCEQCVVNSMCKNPCDLFVKYIDKIEETPILSSSVFVASQIRWGNATIKEGNIIWRTGELIPRWRKRIPANNA